MRNNKAKYVQGIAIAINILMITIPFAISWCIYYNEKMMNPFYSKGNFVVIGLFVILYSSFGKFYGGFLISLVRISEMVYSQVIALLIVNPIMYTIILLLIRSLPNLIPMILVFTVQLLLSALWARVAHRWYFSHIPASKTAIIYDEREGLEKLINEYSLEKKFEIKIIATAKECLDNIDMLKDVETIFLSGVHSSDRNVILKYCLSNDISAYVIPRIGDLIMSGAKRMHLFHLPIMRVNRYNPSIAYRGLKRIMDIVLSLIALIVFLPVMLITAIAIKAADGGPVFYTQERLTKDGKKFKIHKFRSMIVDAEKDGVPRLSSGDSDGRITPVGRFIRKVRIDELPQFIDVLAGNLSLVGPRPERPELAACYQKELPEFALRLQAKAGLTGYRQVYGKYNSDPYDKLQMDLMYISNPSLIVDMQIILATIKILFMPESTEGVDKNAMTDFIEKHKTIKN